MWDMISAVLTLCSECMTASLAGRGQALHRTAVLTLAIGGTSGYAATGPVDYFRCGVMHAWRATSYAVWRLRPGARSIRRLDIDSDARYSLEIALAIDWVS